MIWPDIYRAAHSAYGDLRGYGRRAIRAQVKEHLAWQAGELARYSQALFRERCKRSMDLFPSYRAKVQQHCGDAPACDETLDPGRLPVWTREDLRRWFDSTEAVSMPGAWIHSTGGTSGVPSRFFVTRESFEWRVAVSDRGYACASAQAGIRSVYVWGSPIGVVEGWKRALVSLHHRLQRRRFFDAFVLDDEKCRLCCDLINRARPDTIVGYAGCLVILANFARQHPGVLRHRAATAVTAAEGLQEGQSGLLQETLADGVFQSYGSREFMLIGMECNCHNGYHLNTDNLYVEVVDESGRPVKPGTAGRILVTDLHNDATPFVRYEIGDLGVLNPEPCSCGLPFPMLAKLEGRTQDVVQLSGDRKMSALFLPHLMKEFRWVRAYQLLQHGADRFTMQVVADDEISGIRAAALREGLLQRMGPHVAVEVRCVDQLARTPNGKTPLLIRR